MVVKEQPQKSSYFEALLEPREGSGGAATLQRLVSVLPHIRRIFSKLDESGENN